VINIIYDTVLSTRH